VTAFRAALRAAVSAALVVGLAAPSAAQGTSQQESGTLPSGVAYTLAPDPAQGTASIGLWYRAPDAGFGARPFPGLARLAAAAVAGSAPITGTPLGRLVGQYGGRIGISAYPDSIAITALVPADRASEVIRAMTTDYFAPVVTQNGLELAQHEVSEDALFASVDPEQALEDALGAALFSTGPLHDGTIGSLQAIREASLDDVRAYAERAFRPSNAILVLTGNVDRRALAAVGSRAGTSSGSEAPAPQTPLATPASLHRQGRAAGIGLAWIGPPIASEADATALDFIADAYFTSQNGIVQKALGSRDVTVTGKFVTYHDPGIFLVTISGDGAAAARPLVEHALAAASKPMDGKAFEAARAAFVYDILQSGSTPNDLADTFGWYAVEGNAPYAPIAGGTQGRYLRLVAGLSPRSVARVAARYLGRPPGVVTLTKAPEGPVGPPT
jgi:predicted Zn-dependent peptidase